MRSPLISLHAVRFKWRPVDPLIIDIDRLEIAVGQRMFIKGPSGSGKTTLLNLIGGIAVPQSGAITLAGTDITKLDSRKRDRFRVDNIGFIFQMFNLVPYLSMLENVVLPCRFSETRRNRALKNAASLEEEASRLLAHMELDVPALSKAPVAHLSVGQQQRVAVARSLIGAPQIIIADEPTSALDADARQSFLKLLFDEVRNAESTLMFVSHDEGLEKYFDHTIPLAEINQVGNSCVDPTLLYNFTIN